ncbi:MAG: hypothetical protein AB7N54_13150 [Alphaproteobacteria bacterium]
MPTLSPRERAIRQRLKDDLPHYAAKCLRVRTESEALRPLAFTRAQLAVHAALEAQRRETGRVRALVVKARKTGVSTYVCARHFHRATHERGARAFILAHSAATSAALFAIVRRFHAHLPAAVRPRTRSANARGLEFGGLDSGYGVATAGTREVGRGDTIQLFHGSEAAFWPAAGGHVAGALTAVPDAPGSEIVLESTANGVGGPFHALVQEALAGRGDFRVVFLPWFDHERYRLPRTEGFRPSPAWAAYGAAHGLAADRLAWAFARNALLAAANGDDPDAGPCPQFRQEFPATVDEAFQAGGTHALIDGDTVARARRFAAPEPAPGTPVILGLDVARNAGGGDLSWLIDRCGRRLGGRVNEHRRSADTMEIAGWLARALEATGADMAFVDAGGGGAAVYDRLVELGFRRRVTLVHFGGRAGEPRRYANKRAEMGALLRDWLADAGGAQLPDDDLLHRHLCAPGFRWNSNDQLVLEAKDDIRARLGFSPDGFDAAALTFAFPVRGAAEAARRRGGERTSGSYDVLGW